MSSSVSFDKLRFVRKIKTLAYIMLLAGVLLGMAFIVFAYFKPKAAGIYIESDPISTVYIDGQEKGTTPYKENLPPKEVVVRLVSTQDEDILEPLETKTTLLPGVETVVRHDFSTDSETAATEVISFERTEQDRTSISIVTMPEDVKLLIDGKERAFSPYKTTGLSAGEHNILISESGYEDRVVKIKTHKGYNLTLFVNMAKSDNSPQEELSPEPTPIPDIRARILSTGTGFLRVRSKPGLDGLELARVEPGEVYDLADTEPQDGWYLIEYSPAETGWVSAEYIEILGDIPESSQNQEGPEESV